MCGNGWVAGNKSTELTLGVFAQRGSGRATFLPCIYSYQLISIYQTPAVVVSEDAVCQYR